MDTKAFHCAVAAGNTAVRHGPHHIVQRLRLQRDVVPEGIMGALSLRDRPVRLRLHRVDEIGKLVRVLDKKDRRIVADQIEDTLFGIELCGEAANITHGIR